MRSYIAFYKKEWMDYIRNYKLFIMIIVFAIIGLMSPFTAKFMPEIIKQFMPPGMSIKLPEPSNIDSWTQFFKNASQMGIIVAVVIFSTMMSHEYEKGTLVNLVTKGLPRRAIVAAKYGVMLSIWTISYWVCFFITLIYTIYYFPGGKTAHLILSAASFYFFGIMLLSVVMLGSVIFKNAYGSLLLTVGFTAVLFIVNLFYKAAKWSPLGLANSNIKILQGTLGLYDIRYPLAAAVLVILCAFGLSLKVFDKKLL